MNHVTSVCTMSEERQGWRPSTHVKRVTLQVITPTPGIRVLANPSIPRKEEDCVCYSLTTRVVAPFLPKDMAIEYNEPEGPTCESRVYDYISRKLRSLPACTSFVSILVNGINSDMSMQHPGDSVSLEQSV
jgi:hypothetical protein